MQGDNVSIRREGSHTGRSKQRRPWKQIRIVVARNINSIIASSVISLVRRLAALKIGRSARTHAGQTEQRRSRIQNRIVRFRNKSILILDCRIRIVLRSGRCDIILLLHSLLPIPFMQLHQTSFIPEFIIIIIIIIIFRTAAQSNPPGFW